DQHSGDYKSLSTVPRPGHADFTARIRYGDELNMAGGGPFSARMTAPLCIAGGIAIQILEEMGIKIGAHILSIGDEMDAPLDPVNIPEGLADRLKTKEIAVIDPAAEERMAKVILDAKDDLDSVGGVIEAFVTGLPAGIGGAMYDGVESGLAPILFGIPAVKGVEFGAGFEATRLRGSVNNDPFYFDNGVVKTRTNNHGGILGGITSGMPLIARLAFKPTPSISLEQDSVDLETGEDAKLVIKGRHDPCVVTRAVPIVEAALAIGLLDCIMEDK
ncbi:MAG: chorismate synthase, partial [Eubacterium sp.]|nr:chorismate synthase [Candidatus Colimonas fimequi]